MSRISEILESEYVKLKFKVKFLYNGKWVEFGTTVENVQGTSRATYDVALRQVIFSPENHIVEPKKVYNELIENPKNYSVNLVSMYGGEV